MRIRWQTTLILTAIILAPFFLMWAYRSYTTLPARVTIASGPVNGEWYVLSHNLKTAIESQSPIRVDLYDDATAGSLENLRLLNEGKVDFALYMRGSRRLSASSSDLGDDSTPMFVANLYEDMCMFLVRRDLYESVPLHTPADLIRARSDGSRFRVSVGKPRTGEHSVARVVLDYYLVGHQDCCEQLAWDYEQVETGFRDGTLDAAFITAGHQAPIYDRLVARADALCIVGEIPEVDAIVMRNVGLQSVTIPAGLFRAGGLAIPSEDVLTVGSQTMLLTRSDVSSQAVEEITRVVLSEEFVQQNQLSLLSQRGIEFAGGNPEFPLHVGAMNVYDPRLRPLVDPEFMDLTENARSFGVSLLIGGFLAYRWYRQRTERAKEHRLDDYFTQLMKIDRTALSKIDNEAEAVQVQKALERAIALRNEALREFSAKDFDEERAVDCFLSLCESITAGFRSRLLRWELLRALNRLAVPQEAVRDQTGGPDR